VSDDVGKDIPGGDPFIDPNDPAAVEREERRREREAKRAQKRAKKKQKEAAAPPPPPKEEPPPPPRTPEQEFWDEPAEPPTPPPGQEPAAKSAPDPEQAGLAERGRRRLLRRRKGGAASAGAAGGAAAAEGATPAPPPTGESRRPEQSAPATSEQPTPGSPGPRTAESPRPDPNQPTGETAFPATAEHAVPGGRASATQEQRALPPRPMEETGAGDWEPPPPRDDWFDESDDVHDDDAHDDGDPRMAGAARSGRRHGDDGGKGRGGPLGALLRHPFRVLGVIVLVIVLLFFNAFFQPFHGDGHGRVAVTIPKGSSVGEVADLLEKKGVISGGFLVSGSTLFQARVTLAGDRSNLIAGKFVLAKDMSYGDAINALTKEPEPKEQVKPGIVTVTIPEGMSRPLTAQLLKEDGLKGNYLKATRKSKFLNPEKYGGKNVKSLEGFLYPDTWEFKTSQPISNLVQLQLADFKKKIKKVKMKYAKSKNLTIFDVVTIASMIEREAGVPKQRKLVASVIYNRLHEGMTLGIDSTIRFATGNYEKPLTESQLESPSPYNTRTHAGLPPGPINSPGLAALNAAAHPAHTDFLFYVNNPNSCNELTFAKTEGEFLADAAKYEKAREANGGNEPSTCK
jgi:uncharacterized YceG family protein